MKKIIILNKNKSVEIVKEKNFKYEKKMEFILIPLNSYELDDVFVCVKANKYMNFDNAKLEITLANAVNDIDYDDFNSITPFNNLNITTSSIIELYNYIQSINRLEYLNDLLNANLECTTQRVIDILTFKIVLYKNNECIFEYTFKRINDADDVESLEYDLGVLDYGFHDIFKGIKDIYGVISDDVFINKNNNKWSFKDDNYTESLCGIILPHTHTLYFVSPREYYEIGKVLEQTIVIELNMVVMEDQINIKNFQSVDDVADFLSSGNCEYYDSFSLYINRVIMLEYMIYAKFLYSSIILSYQTDIGLEGFNIITTIINGNQKFSVIFDKDTIPHHSQYEYILERMRK